MKEFPHITSRDKERSCSSHFLKQITNFLEQHVDQGLERMLDIGCGYGGIASTLKDRLALRDVYGIDRDASVLSEAEQKGIRAIQWNITETPLPFPADHFDLIVSFGVLDYLPWFDDVLFEIHRLLSKDGKVVISLPNLGSWHNRLFLLFGYQPRDIEISRNWVVGTHPYYSRSASAPVGHIHSCTTSAFVELMERIGFETNACRGLRPTNVEMKSMAAVLDRAFSRSASLARRFLYIGSKSKSLRLKPERSWWNQGRIE